MSLVPSSQCMVPGSGLAPSAQTTMANFFCRSKRSRTTAVSLSMWNGRSGTTMACAPAAMPAFSAIQPVCRPMTSTTMTRWWDSAVVFSRSSASVATETAVSKPKVTSVAAMSLSMVFGTPTIGRPASLISLAAFRVPSPPIGMTASRPRSEQYFLARSTPSRRWLGWTREEPRMVPPWARMPLTESRVRGRWWPSRNPRHPSSNPMISSPWSTTPRCTTERITAFRPGQSPPLVSTPIRISFATPEQNRGTAGLQAGTTGRHP